MDPSSFPPCKVLVRSKEGLEVYELDEEQVMNGSVETTIPRPFLCKGATSIPFVTAPDGSHVYVHLTGHGLVKCAIPESGAAPSNAMSSSDAPFFSQDTKGVQMMDLSPNGSYLLTWERWHETICPNNLRVWETATGKLVGAFAQRNIKRDSWPYLQWTHDERMAALLTTNEVRFYPATNLSSSSNDPSAVRFSDKLRITNVTSISLPRQTAAGDGSTNNNQPSYLFTAFVAGTKDKPARAGLYRFIPGTTKSDAPPVLSKSLFQAEDMKVDWSPAGDAALLTLQTAVDKSGQSYYGSSQLFLMRYGEPDVVAVPLPQEGPVASVGWLPDATKPPCFAAVAGKMPPLGTLHHGKTGKATFLFGNAHRNVVSWSPHGRFLCLAGFGNMAGGMSFWDRNKQKLINNGCVENAAGTLRAGPPVVGYDWSPSSRWFLCSTCSPRMNVDNGVRLFRYNGHAVKTVPWNNQHYEPDKLLQAAFCPAQPNVYPDRPQSPPPEGFDSDAVTKSTATLTSAPPGRPKAAPAATTAAASSAGKYVPPSARNRVGGSSLAERLRREKEGTLQTASRVVDQKVKTPQGERAVVGTSSAGAQGKSKSALKREKEKKKKLEQEQQQQQQQEEQQQAASSNADAGDPEKRARKIKKTLKQIDDLKQKDASTLNDDQKAKLASEDQLRQELEQLGL